MHLSIFCRLSFFCLCAGVPAFSLTNLVRNPGFEEGIVGWRGASSTARITTEVRTGSKALAIPSESDHSYIYQDIKVVPGKVYTVSAWIKQTSDPEFVSYVLLRYFNTAGVTTQTRTLHEQPITYIRENIWTNTVTYSLAPEGAMTLRVHLWVAPAPTGGPVTGYFDDISVFEDEYLNPKANSLTNPGFENGTTSWSDVGPNETSSSELPRSGSKSLRISSNGNWSTIFQEVPAAPLEGFHFSGYSCVRTLSGDSVPDGLAYFLFSFMNQAGGKIGGWLDISYPNFHTYGPTVMDLPLAPPGTAKLKVECWLAPGQVIGYYDDLELLRYQKAPPPGIVRVSTFKPQTNGIQRSAVCDILGRKMGIFPASAGGRPPMAVNFLLPTGRHNATKSINIDRRTR